MKPFLKFLGVKGFLLLAVSVMLFANASMAVGAPQPPMQALPRPTSTPTTEQPCPGRPQSECTVPCWWQADATGGVCVVRSLFPKP